MDSKARDALLFNRVKIMKFCDYFIVTAPLIARRILPLEKHKEFKNVGGSAGTNVDPKAGNNARLDSLLEFLDECSTPGCFEAFVEGVKNCEGQKTFAKVLKKHAEEGTAGVKPPRISIGKPRAPAKPKVGTPLKRPASFAFPGLLGNSSIKVETPTAGSSVGSAKAGLLTSTPAAAKKPKKPSAKKISLLSNGPPLPGVADVLAALSSGTSSTVSSKKASKPTTAKANKKPKIQLNGQGIVIKQEVKAGGGAGQPKKEVKKEKGAKKEKKAVATPTPKPRPSGISFPLTPTQLKNESVAVGITFTKGPGTSTQVGSVDRKPFISKVPAGSPFRRRASTGASKLKQMTFREAEEKQRSATRATTFSFVNPSASVKTIHFNNKSDLFYEGCPTKANNQLCAKKVQLKGKGKKYVCKEKHENESYELFPRLYVTFEDTTTHMQTTLYRENVEVLAGKPVPDLHRMDDESLKGEFLKAHNKIIPIEVKCKKILKKEVKKAGGATWENVATIITESDSGPSAVKRSRKSND